MRKIYALISATILTGFAGFAQVEIRANENGQVVGDDLSGTTVTINVTSDQSITRVYTLTNVSGNMQSLTVERFRVTEVTGWLDGISWAPDPDPNFMGQCFAASSMATNPWATPNAIQLSNGTNAIIIPAIFPNGAGCGQYRYIVMDGNVALDSIDLEVCSTLSLNEPKEGPGITVYPNPADNYLNITATGITGTGNLRITDVLGKVVYSEETGSVKKVDVSNFKNGVYLVTLLDRGSVIQTRRVVISHQ